MTAWLEAVFSWVLCASWHGSVLIILVLFAQWLLRRVLSAEWHSSLWLLVLVRLSLPVTLESSVSVFNYFPQRIAGSQERDRNTVRDTALPVARVHPPRTAQLKQEAPVSPGRIDRNGPESVRATAIQETAHRTWSWKAGVPVLWLVGALLLAARLSWLSRRLSRRIGGKGANPALLALLEECKRSAGIRKEVRLAETPEVRSPALYGFFTPRLLFPLGVMANFSREELTYVVLHELHHVRRRDIALNWLATILQILHWFNPLVWFAFRCFRSDRELACDERVLLHCGPERAGAYGRTILKLLQCSLAAGGAPGMAGILEERNGVKRRILRILCFRRRSGPWWTLGLASTSLLSLVALTDAKQAAPGERGSQVARQEMGFRVVDAASGHPIPGAILNGKFATDASGWCAFSVSPPARVTASAEGYVPRFVLLSENEEQPAQYIFRMDRGQTIGGVVLEEQGHSIAGVQVRVFAGEFASQEREGTDLSIGHLHTTDANGRWTCQEVPQDLESVILKLIHRNYRETYYCTGRLPDTIFLGTGETRLVPMDELRLGGARLAMQRGLEVRGIVLDTQGTPIAGAHVSQGAGWARASHLQTQTGADGGFVFNNASPGKMALTVEARGFAPESRALDIHPAMEAARFYLARTPALKGRVVDDNGVPIQGAMVRAASNYTWEAKTDSEGRFVWDSGPSKSALIIVRATGFKEATFSLEPGEREHEVRLARVRSIQVTGRVFDATTGKPIPRFKILTSRNRSLDGWILYRQAVEGKNGVFVLTLDDSFHTSMTTVVADSTGSRVVYSIGFKIEAEGYLPDVSQSVAIEDGDQELQFALVRGAGITGSVLLPNGAPAREVRVFVLNRLPASLDPEGRIRPAEDARWTTTDSSGKFALTPEPETRGVAVSHDEGIAVVSIEQLGASPAVVLQAWGRIEGELRLGNNPAANQTVVVTPVIGANPPLALAFRFATLTDARGHFVVERVPPGEHEVALLARLGAAGPQQRSHGIPVVVRPGKTATVGLGGTQRPVAGKVVLQETVASAVGRLTLKRSARFPAPLIVPL